MTQKSDVDSRIRTALFPGSFNPFTKGHYDLVQRTLKISDRIIIAIGINVGKQEESDIEKRVEAIEKAFKGDPRVIVATYSKLTGEMANELGADFIVRGVRNAIDYEYEGNMATANRNLFGIETVILPATPELAWLSSSTVRELERFGYDASGLLPE